MNYYVFARCLLHAAFLLGLLFNCEEGGEMFFRNLCRLSADCMELYPIKIELFLTIKEIN
jgi:hypothetical protein